MCIPGPLLSALNSQDQMRVGDVSMSWNLRIREGK